MKKYLPYIMVFVLAVLVAAYFSFSYFKDKNQYITQYKKNFINEQFSKKKLEIERIYTLMYQSLRTVSLLPSVRQISGSNRMSETEDVVKSGRFTREGAQTVQQLYNNLVTNVSVSEIYAVLSGFDHSKGEVPFFMFDKVVLFEGQKVEEKKDEKTPDTPEESEESEYAYFPEVIKQYSESVFEPEKGLSSIIPTTSPIMRTCDNDQYKSKKNQSEKESYGFVYSVPFYGHDNKFKGIIVAIIRQNALEAALVGVPKIIVTEEDKAEFAQKKWAIPKDPVPFVLINKKNNIIISDRRNKLSDADISNYQNAKTADVKGDFYFEKIDENINADWELIYDFKFSPWMEGLGELKNSLYLKLGITFAICLFCLSFIYFQSSQSHKILHDVFSTLNEISQKLISATGAAEKNGQDLSISSQTLSSVVGVMASAIGQIESQTVNNTDSTKKSEGISSELLQGISLSQKCLEQLKTEMENITQSNKQIQYLVELIEKINLKTKRIEEIVFKTQILSFNASIEAARAGEFGRGFDVVSQEVGVLASAIKQASFEISEIVKEGHASALSISTTNSTCVDNGNSSMEELSKAVAAVMSASADLNKILNDISAASQEQLLGIKEISNTATEIQNVMNNNLNLSVTSIDLAKNLKSQTDGQMEAIGKIAKTFDLDQKAA